MYLRATGLCLWLCAETWTHALVISSHNWTQTVSATLSIIGMTLKLHEGLGWQCNKCFWVAIFVLMFQLWTVQTERVLYTRELKALYVHIESWRQCYRLFCRVLWFVTSGNSRRCWRESRIWTYASEVKLVDHRSAQAPGSYQNKPVTSYKTVMGPT